MKYEIEISELYMYIRDYRLNNNGEYPAPTIISRSILDSYLNMHNQIINVYSVDKKWTALDIKNFKRICEVLEDLYISTLKTYLEKFFEKYLKTRIKFMKRELLETSAKICLHPARIQRLLAENLIDLDDIDTLYDI